MVNDQLPASVEQLGQGLLSVGTIKNIFLVDLNHRQPPPLCVHLVMLFRDPLLIGQKFLARREPFRS
jgi:hypothetical protein